MRNTTICSINKRKILRALIAIFINKINIFRMFFKPSFHQAFNNTWTNDNRCSRIFFINICFNNFCICKFRVIGITLRQWNSKIILLNIVQIKATLNRLSDISFPKFFTEVWPIIQDKCSPLISRHFCNGIFPTIISIQEENSERCFNF